MYVTRNVWAGRKEMGVNGGVKKLVWRWSKKEELFRNGCKKEIGIYMTGTGHRELLCNRQ